MQSPRHACRRTPIKHLYMLADTCGVEYALCAEETAYIICKPLQQLLLDCCLVVLHLPHSFLGAPLLGLLPAALPFGPPCLISA